MKWFPSFNLMVRSSITTLREKIEDPERMLHQLIIDMEEEMERVRESVAEAIADEIDVARELKEARSTVALWEERAIAAVKSGDETNGRAALEQKLAAESRAEKLERELAEQKKQTGRLERAVAELESKIRQARQRKTLLVARMARTDAKRKVDRAVDRATGGSAFAEFTRLERKVERREAKAAAYDRLAGRDPEVDELDEEFSERERTARLTAELDELAARIRADESPDGERTAPLAE